MTHFLARLVERARGTAPRVEPLLPSRFAPALPATAGAAQPGPGVTVGKNAAPPPRAAAADSRASKADPETSAGPRETAANEATRNSPHGNKEPATSNEESDVPASTRALLLPLRRDEAEPVPSPTMTRSRADPETPSRPGPNPPPTARRHRSPGEGSARSSRAGNASASHEPPGPAEAPVIRVTIGRIEVRAASPSPPPASRGRAPRAAAGPSLTLDHYLRARQEGRRPPTSSAFILMSSPLAIAAVSAVLQSFLQNSVIQHDLAAILGGSVTVSAEPPDRIKADAASPDRINLFLFQATENQGWRNLGLPLRAANGERLGNTPLALDLHYLLTAYGSRDFHAEVLLGHAMFVLHEMSVFTRNAIRAALPAPPPITLPNGLTAAGLADQIEQIKLTPEPMSVEEISKIWSALHAQYRPTAVYKASVVLLEAARSVRPTLPVRSRHIAVLPFQQPVIDAIQSQSTDGAPIVSDEPILAGFNLVIAGRHLRGATATRVLIDGSLELTPADDRTTAARVTVPLPASLQPGLHFAQVVHRIDFGSGTPAEPHRGVESNGAAFVLAPRISTPAPISAPRNGTLTLGITPPVGRAQRVTLLAGGRTIPIAARPAAGPAQTASLDFPIPGDFPVGAHLLRVQIDGAESPLAVDGSGQFAEPTVTIT